MSVCVDVAATQASQAALGAASTDVIEEPSQTEGAEGDAASQKSMLDAITERCVTYMLPLLLVPASPQGWVCCAVPGSSRAECAVCCTTVKCS